MSTPNPEQVEAMANELTALRAQLGEAEVFIGFLRQRNALLAREVCLRDSTIVQRDRSIVSLTLQLAAAEPAPRAES